MGDVQVMGKHGCGDQEMNESQRCKLGNHLYKHGFGYQVKGWEGQVPIQTCEKEKKKKGGYNSKEA